MSSNYSGLEKLLDSLLPEWIVPVGRVLRELEVGNKDSGNLRWGFRIHFKGKTVSKATPLKVDGNLTWRLNNTKFAIPDFVVLDRSRFVVYQKMVESAKKGLMTVNPFRHLMCASGWYIEALGNYYHTGGFSQGLSKDAHEAEIIAANKTWDKRGRKEERKDKSGKKTHKENGLDKATLEELLNKGFSYAKIGRIYGMTGEGVSYRVKKWEILLKR